MKSPKITSVTFAMDTKLRSTFHKRCRSLLEIILIKKALKIRGFNPTRGGGALVTSYSWICAYNSTHPF